MLCAPARASSSVALGRLRFRRDLRGRLLARRVDARLAVAIMLAEVRSGGIGLRLERRHLARRGLDPRGELVTRRGDDRSHVVTDGRSARSQLMGSVRQRVDVGPQLLCGRAQLSRRRLDGRRGADDDLDLGPCGREIRGELHPFRNAVVGKQVEIARRSRDQGLKVSRGRHVLGCLGREDTCVGREGLGGGLEEVEQTGVGHQPIGVVGDLGSEAVQRIADLGDRGLELCRAHSSRSSRSSARGPRARRRTAARDRSSARRRRGSPAPARLAGPARAPRATLAPVRVTPGPRPGPARPEPAPPTGPSPLLRQPRLAPRLSGACAGTTTPRDSLARGTCAFVRFTE